MTPLSSIQFDQYQYPAGGFDKVSAVTIQYCLNWHQSTVEEEIVCVQEIERYLQRTGNWPKIIITFSAHNSP